MDPKQERVLRDGTASAEDQPRDTDRESVRWQAEHPPVDDRPKPERRTAAVPDVRVNLQSGTPVDQMARAMGAEPIPEMGRRRSRGPRGNGGRSSGSEAGVHRASDQQTDETGIPTGEAQRTLKARREHSKGDGNFPSPEPSEDLADERPEDRTPKDLPKSRDDRSAPKGNVTVGQPDRNPAREVRDDYEPRRPREPRPSKAKTPAGRSRSRATPTRAKSRASVNKRSPKRSTAAARRRTATPAKGARGPRKPPTKRALTGAGPKARSGKTRGGKR